MARSSGPHFQVVLSHCSSELSGLVGIWDISGHRTSDLLDNAIALS